VYRCAKSSAAKTAETRKSSHLPDDPVQQAVEQFKHGVDCQDKAGHANIA
jgi:hypothetical protein